MEKLYDMGKVLYARPKRICREDQVIYEMIFHAFVVQEKQYGLNASKRTYRLT